MATIFIWTFVAILARSLERTWWSPGAFLSLTMWISAVGTTLLAPEYYMSFYANAYLAMLTMITSYASAVGAILSPRRMERVCFIVARPRALFLFGMTFSLISLYITLHTIGIGLSDMLSPTRIWRAAQASTYLRYTQGLSFPIYYNISNAMLLTYAMAVAVIIGFRRDFRWHYILPLLVYASANMLITTRAPIIFLILLMIFTAVYAIRLRDGIFPPFLSVRALRTMILILSLIAGLFFVFQVLRFGEHSNRSAADVWDHLRRWPWGGLPGFSLWFDGFGGSDLKTSPGFYTFMGIFDILGIAERHVGIFLTYVNLTSTEPANIFTAFRGLALDFGWVGAIFFMAFIAAIGGFAGNSRIVSPAIGLSVYVLVMAFIAFSFVVSFFAYTANLVALVFFPICVLVFFRLKSRTVPPFVEGLRNA